MSQYSKNIIALVVTLFFGFQLQATVVEFSNDLKVESMPIGLMLTWSTIWENDIQQFEVERSKDGETYVKVGDVKTEQLNQDGGTYRFLDVDPLSGNIFYRIKAVSEAVEPAYSGIIEVTPRFKNDWIVTKISEVVTSSIFEVEYDTQVAGEMNYRLEDKFGEMYMIETMYANEGGNQIAIDMQNFPEGSYRLFMELNAEQEILNLKRIYTEEEKASKVLSLKQGEKTKSKN